MARAKVYLKRCCKCKRGKPLSEFSRDKNRSDGYAPHCKPCWKKWWDAYYAANREKYYANKKRHYGANRQRQLALARKSKYGILPEEYDQLLRKQKGLCAVCKKPETRSRNGVVFALHVDHDARTDLVRELLCCRCNAGLGYFCEDVKLFRAAIRYLKKHGRK